MAVRINLFEDLANVVRSQMSNDGYDVTPVVKDDHRALIAFFKLGRYVVTARPRRVCKPPDFDSAGHEDGLAVLENKIRHGEDLAAHLTRNIDDISKPDQLLDHWGIHHFHLGTELDPSTGRIRRTRHIMLCRIDDVAVYFLRVDPHGSGSPMTWYQPDLIEIIHQNWPETIEWARLKGVVAAEHQLSAEEIRQLRRANLNHTLEVGGAVYMGPGMGTTGDGTNSADLMRADMAAHAARLIEARINDDYERIKENARRQGYHFTSPATFVLQEVQLGSYWDIREINTGYRFREWE